MGCIQSLDGRATGTGTSRNNPDHATKITVSPLIASSSPWVPPVAAALTIENALKFLRMRRVYSNDTAQQLKLFGYLRLPSLAPNAEIAYYTQCRATLMSLYTLVVRGELRETSAPAGFGLLMDNFPGFSLPAPYTVDSIVQRVQESKCCAPNAVALVQVANINRTLLMRGLAPAHNMVDVAEFWRHRASTTRIQNQVFGTSKCEGSAELLKSFLQPDSIVAASGLGHCEERLASCGLGLIAYFKVYDDLYFAADGTIHFSGKPQGECVLKSRVLGEDPEYRL